MLNYELEKVSNLLKLGIFCLTNDELIAFQEQNENNPISENKLLRSMLTEKAKCQEEPYIYKDEFQVCFAAIKKGKEFFFIGPMSLDTLVPIERHRFYQKYHIKNQYEKNLRRFLLTEILDIVGLLSELIGGKLLTNETLLYVNTLVEESREKEQKEQILFSLKKDEEELYHHTYQEERKLLECVKEGKIKEALKMNHNMDVGLGKLSGKEINHWKNAVIVGITLCTRAAIDGGISPSVGYQISDFYIQKCDSCRDIAQMLEYRDHAVEDLTKRVQEYLQKRSYSNYVEQCKDYVLKHYREKIYQDTIAESLGISASYLSRLFKKNTGICLQEYITQIRVERAANLLIYSEESLARIAEYVNFPSQSYFGKVFRQYKQISPKKYREQYKTKEFV